MCWVYLLKDKSKAFETFKKFHVWIQNEAQTKIGTFCTNNGGESTSTNSKIIFNNMSSKIK